MTESLREAYLAGYNIFNYPAEADFGTAQPKLVIQWL